MITKGRRKSSNIEDRRGNILTSSITQLLPMLDVLAGPRQTMQPNVDRQQVMPSDERRRRRRTTIAQGG